MWREQTRDPLLDSASLERLAAEVNSMKSKKAAKKHRWGYPDYFFGKQPEFKKTEIKKQGNPVQ
jgi:hypothetical protein